jgi:hypothetical protein
MERNAEHPEHRIGRTLVAAILLATCVKVWVGPAEVLPIAAAQIPDSGMQRKQMVDEIQQTNALLGEIIHILKTQGIKVVLPSADKAGAGAALIQPGNP